MNIGPILSHKANAEAKNLRRRIRITHRFSSALFVISICFAAVGAFAQHFDRNPGGSGGGNPTAPDPAPQTTVTDPGPRSGAPGAGSPVAGLSAAQSQFFTDGQTRFGETETVPTGLGPRFNSGASLTPSGGACAECHAAPSIGGSSPATNPQVADATIMGATNTVPDFITINGPVREARFVNSPDGTPDGGVHDLFTVTGRSDATGCTLQQPNFAANEAAHNVIFRIPTPTYGDGLIENISDATILANQAANAAAKASLGINGHVNRTAVSGGVPNRSGNDGTITKFGWKAQNKSPLMFAGEAYNVEVGVTNELFGSERANPGDSPLPSSCIFNPTPEDISNPGQTGAAVNSDITAFSFFMRYLDQPTPAPSTPSTTNGLALFSQVGCALCHTPSMTTAASNEASGLSNVQANLFSDLLVHNMGTGLADGVTQGGANGQEFRTAPLWGLGQRVYFLHDGRTSNLIQAIQAHASQGSEANGSVSLFNRLTASQQQDLINFLRSL
jgi:cytochrome c peroxidase